MEASDGNPIAFRYHRGAAGAPVLALVHSLVMDHRFWDPVVKEVGDRASVLCIDARGHGNSGRGEMPRAGYSSQRMADDLAEVMDHLGIARVVVGGASMGGCVALQFAGSHAARTAGVALIDTTAWYGPTAPQDWEGRAQKAVVEGLASLVDFQKTRWFSDAFRAAAPEVVDECIRIFLANDLDAYVATCGMLGAFDGRELLSGIRVPTWVVVGEEDYAAPVAMAQALHHGIAGARIEVIQGARHLTPLEVPERIAARLLDLCREVTA